MWATWCTTATRPGTTYSYTNNWPPEPLAGNEPTSQALVWSVLSLIALLGGAGIILFVFGRFHWLGWHAEEVETQARRVQFRAPETVRLTPSQRATAWFFLVVAALFLLQGLLGGVNAHYHVEPEGFYGISIAHWLPYNLSRMWHLQLALFFVSASYLALGIFLVPMIARREPRHQSKLALALFGALVLVVVGSLLGEAASIQNYIRLSPTPPILAFNRTHERCPGRPAHELHCRGSLRNSARRPLDAQRSRHNQSPLVTGCLLS